LQKVYQYKNYYNYQQDNEVLVFRELLTCKECQT